MKLLHKPLRQFCIVTVLCAGSLQLLPTAHASVPFHLSSVAARDDARHLNQNPAAELYKSFINFWDRLRYSLRNTPF